MAATSEDLMGRSFDEWASAVRALAGERNAVILAHSYQVPWVQEVADFVGDSLELSRQAAATPAEVIVFCGVHFMAETAKILSPAKTVLIPDPGAGCSLAESITAAQLRAFKQEHPDAVVVTYVNTSAEVKAESDYCCTSANAAEIVSSIPPGREIIFCPDMFLGAHVERVTGRKMHIWMGECHVHAGIEPSDVEERLAEHPAAEFLIHPECGCASKALYLASAGAMPRERVHVLGTAGMLRRARATRAPSIVVATETGLIHRMRRECPTKEIIPANPDAVCRYMKMITPEKLLASLRDLAYEVEVEEETAARARRAIEAMLAVSPR